MTVKDATLETICGITSPLPHNALPEVAFAGKSNVGKSSLINTLMNRRSLARTSEKPGKTQTINFYRINRSLYLVDLPGYGFAKAPESEKAKWGKMIERYLNSSDQLKAVFLLIDIRHRPGENDRQMYDWILANGYEPILLLTKLDKIKRSQLSAQEKLIRESLNVRKGTVMIPFSSKTKQGREEVWAAIEDLIKT